MPTVNLGRVRGMDGGFGNITCEYIDDGGNPDITIEKSGEDTAKDFHFIFKNIVAEPLDTATIESIANDEVVNTSKVLTGTGLSTLISRLKQKFAPKSHTHDASDITAGQLAAALIANGTITADMLATGAVTGAKIADGTISIDKMDQAFRDSQSRISCIGQTEARFNTEADTDYLEYMGTDERGGQLLLTTNSKGLLLRRRQSDGEWAIVWNFKAV